MTSRSVNAARRSIIPVLAIAAALGSVQDGLSVAHASPLQPPTAVPFAGTPAVGALFESADGTVRHFCTAAIVSSPDENLAITAAHCITGLRLGVSSGVYFAPGYDNGSFPHGRWVVRSAIVDSNWAKQHDPGDDVAFLIVGRAGRRIQKYTGAETLITSVRTPRQVQVVGYPDAASTPITCSGPAHGVPVDGYWQLRFDCGGYTGGTSGGPFLTDVRSATGDGDVIGVIGGYEKGGDSPDVSYSSRFLRNIAGLYAKATG